MPIRRTRRFTALVLVLAMILGCLFLDGSLVPVKAAGDATRIADSSTLRRWEEDYGQNTPNTDKAGRVWTDKSVIDGDVHLYNEGDSSNPVLTVNRSDPSHFLVGLSAIASSKSIVGQDTIPIDVMMVLDVSGSMSNSQSIPDLVNATNTAIQQLLALNVNNRVGVVLFSGNSDFGSSAKNTATVLLPLDRYTAGNNYYITNNSNGGRPGDSNSRIRVANNVKNSAGTSMPGNTKQVEGGTYVQNGIYQAWEQFASAKDTEIDGTKKIPIMVFMGDGAPTAATTSYSNIGQSNFGDGGSTGTKYAFVNQLTMAWVKSKMESTYGREALMYTLGLGIDGLDNSEKTAAGQVLNPVENKNDTLNNWWSQFDGLSAGSTDRNNRIDLGDRDYVYKADDIISSADRYYVDKYFSAGNASDLGDAFQEIIEEIYIQSMYYPTDVENNDASLSGYLTFEDVIGQYMEVKKVNGLAYRDVLYTGKNFAKAVAGIGGTGSQVNPGDYDYYDEFIRSIRERLDITAEQARDLVNTSYQNGYLYYVDDTHFGNKLRWYGDDNGTYLGAYTDGTVYEDATCINESYFLSGEFSTDMGEAGQIVTDLMYITIRVRTDIQTGEQKVIFSIPASLIPQVKYKITIDGDSLEAVNSADVEREGNYPMRLFYEVGASVSGDNAEFKIDESYPHKAEDGTYTLYTNAWSEENGVKTALTTVNFDPSQENEFYYYHKNTKIYTDENGTPATGSKPAAGSAYYVQEVFEPGSNTQITRQYQAITAAALEKAEYNEEEGYWYIPKGTPKRQDEIGDIPKSENETNTASTILHPMMQPNMDNPGTFHIEGRLGNNGLMTVKQNRGDLLIEKDVTGNRGEDGVDFTFTLSLLQPGMVEPLTGDYAYTKTCADGTTQTGTVSDGSQITLKDGERIRIQGLPALTEYTVVEADPNSSGEGYATQVKINGQAVSEALSDKRTAIGALPGGNENGTVADTSVLFINNWTVPDAPFRFTKVDGTAGGENPLAHPLKGAEFRLYRLDCVTPDEPGHNHGSELIEDAKAEDAGCWTYLATKTSADDGLIDFEELPTGFYRLVETKAPGGFRLPKGQWNLTVDAGVEGDSSDDSVTMTAVNPVEVPAFGGDMENGFYIENYKAVNPPLTGGSGGFIFLLAGGVLLLGSGLLFFFRYRMINGKRF